MENGQTDRLDPESVRRLAIVSALAGAALNEGGNPAQAVKRAFHIGDRVKEALEAEEQGHPLKQWQPEK